MNARQIRSLPAVIAVVFATVLSSVSCGGIPGCRLPRPTGLEAEASASNGELIYFGVVSERTGRIDYRS